MPIAHPVAVKLDPYYRFPAAKNPAAAMRAVQAIREGVRILVAHPGAGRPVDRLDPQSANGRSALATAAMSPSTVWKVGGREVGGRKNGGRKKGRDGNGVVILAVRHQREAGYG